MEHKMKAKYFEWDHLNGCRWCFFYFELIWLLARPDCYFEERAGTHQNYLQYEFESANGLVVTHNVYCWFARGWDKSPSLSIVFGLSSKTQWLSELYYADFISFYSPTQLCGGGTTKSNSNELPISVPLSFCLSLCLFFLEILYNYL